MAKSKVQKVQKYKSAKVQNRKVQKLKNAKNIKSTKKPLWRQLLVQKKKNRVKQLKYKKMQKHKKRKAYKKSNKIKIALSRQLLVLRTCLVNKSHLFYKFYHGVPSLISLISLFIHL